MATETFTDEQAARSRGIWQNVILTACRDALMVKAESQESINIRDEARAWLIRDSNDFRHVCDLAGIDPDFIRGAYMSGRINPEMISRTTEKGAAT